MLLEVDWVCLPLSYRGIRKEMRSALRDTAVPNSARG